MSFLTHIKYVVLRGAARAISVSFVMLYKSIKRIGFVLLACFFSLGGAMVGTITGAMKGQCTETGFVRGLGVGALTGAITALQLMEQMINGESFSKVALIWSLIEGRVFMEWVSPAVLKAYQWQVSSIWESSLGEISDIFEVSSSKGLSHDMINNLPMFKISPHGTTNLDLHELSCPICFQDMENGECARKLPNCMHHFHKHCIDEWLFRNASCPICREYLVCSMLATPMIYY